jgi:hypothetical protein
LGKEGGDAFEGLQEGDEGFGDLEGDFEAALGEEGDVAAELDGVAEALLGAEEEVEVWCEAAIPAWGRRAGGRGEVADAMFIVCEAFADAAEGEEGDAAVGEGGDMGGVDAEGALEGFIGLLESAEVEEGEAEIAEEMGGTVFGGIRPLEKRKRFFPPRLIHETNGEGVKGIGVYGIVGEDAAEGIFRFGVPGKNEKMGAKLAECGDVGRRRGRSVERSTDEGDGVMATADGFAIMRDFKEREGTVGSELIGMLEILLGEGKIARGDCDLTANEPRFGTVGVKGNGLGGKEVSAGEIAGIERLFGEDG